MKKKSSKNKSELKIVNVKISAAERKRLQANADKFAQGNLSAWLRHSGRQYTPRRGEKVSLKVAA